MNRVYSFYCDESGMFNARDTHVICPLVVRDGALSVEQLLEFWRTELGDGNWRAFHSVSTENMEVESLFNKFTGDLFKPRYIYPVYTYHKNTISYGFDFYPAMIIKLVLWQCNTIVDDIVTSLHPDVAEGINSNEIYHIDINLYRAQRTVVNEVYLKNFIQSSIRWAVRQRLKEKNITPDAFHFQFFSYITPIADSPFIQVSDLLSYVIRAYLNDGLKMQETRENVKILPQHRLSSSEINNHEIRQLCNDLVSPVRIRNVSKVKKKVVTKPALNIAEIKRPEHVSANGGMLLEYIHTREKEGKTIEAGNVPSALFKRIMDQSRWLRKSEFEALFQAAYNTIRDQRRYDFGGILIDLLYSLIDQENSNDEFDKIWLKGNELKVTDLLLTLNNHRGYDISNDSRIKRALDISKELEVYTSYWGDICTFQNHLAISYQNVFRFEESIKALFPSINYLEKQTKNPFTGGGLKAYEIGALFGTYAQSIAFDAHLRFFNEGENALKGLEDAELFSLLATEHFEKPEDIQRQEVYQAHFKMQRYILAGDILALNEAGLMLRSNEEDVDRFLNLFPQRKALIPAYVVAAALKHAYLIGDMPEWLDNVISVVVANRGLMAAEHPVEQIISYLILISPIEDLQRTLGMILKQLQFSQNIVKTITCVLMAQIEFDKTGTIEDSTIKQVDASIVADALTLWRKYRLKEVLCSYQKKPDRWHVGPMEVLPFNYS